MPIRNETLVLPETVKEIGFQAFAGWEKEFPLPTTFKLNLPIKIANGAFTNTMLYEDFYIPVPRGANIEASSIDDFRGQWYGSFGGALLPEGCSWFDDFGRKVALTGRAAPSGGGSIHRNDWTPPPLSV